MRFHPVLSIVLGLIIAYFSYGFLWLITGYIICINYTLTFGVFNIVFGLFSFLIGGFVTTFLSKEKKIQYGIYFGIINIIIDLLFNYSYLIINPAYYIQIGLLIGLLIIGYFLSAVVGGYLGIIADKPLKLKIWGMRFHPVVSIFLGVIVCFVLYLIAVLCGANAWVWGTFSLHSGSSFGTFLIISSFIMGGFIATFFAREKKIKYGIFEGLCLILVFILWSAYLWSLKHDVINVSKTIFSIGMIFLLVYVGGLFGLINNKKYNGFSPLPAVIAGSVIGYSCIDVLELMTGHLSTSIYLDVVSMVVGVVSFLIGGFITTFLSKDKKIRYGIYSGILITVISIIQMSINKIIYISIFEFVGYVLSAAIGGYLAILLAKHLNKIIN